jgi:peptide/nickel transport system substrate-binding protein
MSRKITLLLGLALVLVLLLGGCGTEQGEPETVIQEVEVTRVVSEEVVITEEVEVTRVVTEEVVVEVPAEAEVAMETPTTYDRAKTLYTTGSAWSPPSDWNPVTNWNYATGTIGLLYEPVLLYDPLSNEFIPWLAESAQWISDDVYEIKIRQGMTWTDGEAITAEDVKFTFELGQRFAGVPWSSLWNWLDNIELFDEYTLNFNFSEPLYQRWERTLYGTAIVPEHLWADRTEEEVTAGANENPIGSGAYMYESHGQDRMVWVKNPNWWATELLGLEVGPERIVDLVNRSNNVSLGMLLQGDLDISNNFLPGVKNLVTGGYGIETYFPESPFMLPANTAALFLNLNKAPMDDFAFRQALAYSIDVSQIVDVVYGGIVTAANPVGLLPLEGWSQYLDQELVDQYGFSYDPEMARTILAEAGYVDTNNDGFVEAPDGSTIQLKIIVPFGWTDWMESINVISRSAQAVGINAIAEFPDFGGYQDQLYGGTFDMAINNFGSGLSSTVWTYYDWLFRHPITEQMTNGNFGRYDNQAVFDLVDELDKTRSDDTEAMQAILSAIQEIQLTELPAIPLWYNGAWYQANTSHWTSFPSSVEGAPKYVPITWGGWWELGGLLTLTVIEPVAAE